MFTEEHYSPTVLAEYVEKESNQFLLRLCLQVVLGDTNVITTFNGYCLLTIQTSHRNMHS